MPSPEVKNRKPNEAKWDTLSEYQWTYFNEDTKKRISFFLRQRLHGKNLDLGGGWYLSYPNSTVIDLSSVGLSYNPAKKKCISTLMI